MKGLAWHGALNGWNWNWNLLELRWNLRALRGMIPTRNSGTASGGDVAHTYRTVPFNICDLLI